MTHIAIQESLDGKNVAWMEKVTDEQYLAGVARSRRLLALVLLPLSPAAAEPPGAPGTAYVYKPDGTRHCDTSAGIPLDSMAEELVRSGIPVHARRKSHDGREGVASCGNPTGSRPSAARCRAAERPIREAVRRMI